MTSPISRRRFLAIAACSAVAGGRVSAATASWRGRALGAEATITLGGIGQAPAAATFNAVAAELSRLEDIFSLFRDDSALSRLNRDGFLDRPPADLLAVLAICDSVNRATGGAFDPSVQPLWSLLASQSCAKAPDHRAARQLVGWSGVRHAPDRIAFERPGMAITLNGIAQGFISDKVATLLRARGYVNVLVDMGEISAVGRNHGTPWSAQVATPDGQPVKHLRLSDRCLAVSAPNGTQICGIGHILEPRRIPAPTLRRLAAVTADTAALADGLSTACCLLDDHDAKAAVATFADARLETLI